MLSFRLYNGNIFLLFQQTAVQSIIEFLFCAAHKIKQMSSVAVISAAVTFQDWIAVLDAVR